MAWIGGITTTHTDVSIISDLIGAMAWPHTTRRSPCVHAETSIIVFALIRLGASARVRVRVGVER